MATTGETPWWDRDRHSDRREVLLARNRIRARLRAWFEAEGFTEVDPAALQISPGNETHLHAFATDAWTAEGARRRLYLHTSPEFAMKKLLAAGETRIFAFAPVWRNGERGPLHAPEFTMLEWYRADAPYAQLMEDCAQILKLAGEAAGAEYLRYRDRTADPYATPERLSVAEAAARFAGVDLLSTLGPDGNGDAVALAAALESAGIGAGGPGETWSDLFSRLLVARIEPALGDGRATILDRYPAVEAALARLAPDDPRVAERFEVFVCGVELANGFGELTDPAEQRRRFEAAMDAKERIYAERYPLDEELLAALERMPPACGCALGFDRLVMLAAGVPRIEDVMWAPPG